METLEQVVKYVQSLHQNDDIGIVLVPLLFTLNIFDNYFHCL